MIGSKSGAIYFLSGGKIGILGPKNLHTHLPLKFFDSFWQVKNEEIIKNKAWL